jgi:cobalt-zinc-cadmium efflux system outer membrane protein
MRLQAGLRINPTLSFERRHEPGGTDTATDVGVEWPLELFRRGARVAAADAEVRVAEHEAADVLRQLAGDVAAAYGDVASAARELALTDEILGAASNQLKLLRARAEEGSTPTLDRDIVDVDVRRIQADRAAQAGRVERALIQLKQLLALPSDAPVTVTQTLEDLLGGDEVAAGAGVDLRPTRPDVEASEARVRAAEERIASARREGSPDVTVFGSYMRMDAGFPQRGVTPEGALERVRGQFNYLTAGAVVTLPLWNRQQGSVAAATAAREAAAARAESARLTAAAEVADARARYEYAQRALTLYQGGVRPLARRNLDTLRETYELGRATVLDVLAEQRRYLETERAYTEALSEAYASRISLRRATGDLP